MKKIILFSLSIIGPLMAMEVDKTPRILDKEIQIAELSFSDAKLNVNGISFLCTKEILQKWFIDSNDLKIADNQINSFTTLLHVAHNRDVKKVWTISELIQVFNLLQQINSNNDANLKSAQNSFINYFQQKKYSISPTEPSEDSYELLDSADACCKDFITNYFIGRRIKKVHCDSTFSFF